MNSDEIIDKISKEIEYDKSEITVESVLEDLIKPGLSISDLVSPINKENNENNIDNILNKDNVNVNDNDLDKILKESSNDFLLETKNNDIDKILKEEPNDIPNDLLNEILNENKNKAQQVVEEEIKKEQKKDEIIDFEKEKEILLLKIQKEEEERKKEEERIKEEERKRKEEKRKKKEEEERKKKEEEERKKKEEEERIKKMKEEYEIKRKEEEKKRKEEEEKIKKKKEEERKKLDSFIPQFPNPVDFVQYIEILKVNTKISGEMQNFFLQNHRKKDNKYNISLISSFPVINKQISSDEINLIFSKKDYLVICRNKSELLIFSMKNQKTINKIIPKNMQNKEIYCLDISSDLQDILCGYKDGTIALINIKNGEIKYTTNKIHKDTSCLEIKIHKKDKENDIYFVSSGGDGQVFYNSFKKMIFWRLNSVLIIKNNIPFFMIKFIHIPKKTLYFYSKLNSLRRYVLLGSSEEIKLYSIEPKIEEIFEIKKPDYIEESVVPDAQVGMGRVPEIIMRFAKKDEDNHLILIVSWGNVIYFYQLTIDDVDIGNEFKEIGYYINLFDILRIGFLNSSVVYCLDKSFGIKILETTKINQGKININKDKSPIVPNKNFKAEIEKSRHISGYISSEKKLIDLETYLYSIIDNDCSINIIGDKQIYIYNLVDWDIFLKELQRSNDYLNLFSVGIDIYNGKMSYFSNLPNEKILKRKIGDFLKEIIPQYVNTILKEKKSNIKDPNEEEKIYECINIAIEVCIELDLVEFLIRTIEPIFEEKEYGDLFLARFEPFILCDKIIKYVLSPDIIINLIDLYNKKDKLEILGQMLLHINIFAMDKPEIKNKLEETNLIIPLIYIYHNGKNEDYFLPLEKMFDYFNSKTNYNKILVNEENNLINYTDAITQKLITLKEIQNSKEYNGHRILWYIKWCLTGKKFPDNSIKMKDNLFDELVYKITFWLLNEKVMDELLKFDPKNYFIIYKNILSIKSLYNKLVMSFQNETIRNKILEDLKKGGITISELNPISLIDYIVDWCKKKNENTIFFYLYDFIIEISKNIDINIRKELRIESICYMLNHYKQTIKKINNQEVETLIKIIIEFLKDEMFNKEDYKQILPSIKDSLFDEIKLFLLEKIEDYKECFKIYIDKKDNEIFIWIHNIINKLKKDSKQYEEFLEAIKENIFALISISLKEFYYLSRQIFKNIKKEVIDSLEKDKNIQLKYIELIIQSVIRKEYDFDGDTETIKNILILHINLLCQLNLYDKIVPAFKSYSLYPFEECLSLCEKAKAHKACIYLYIKEGSIQKAFDLSTSYLENNFKNVLKNVNKENNDEEHKKLLDKYNNSLLDSINICEINENNIEDLWFKLLDVLYKFENESINLAKNENDNKKKQKYEEIYQNIIQNIKDLTETMCSFLSIKTVLEVVTHKNKISEFNEYKELIMKLLKYYNNSKDILSTVKSLFTSFIFQSQHTFQDYMLKGDLLKEKCDKCNKEFIGENIFLFNCKHTFHKECMIVKNTELGKEGICPICQDNYNESENNTFEGKSLIKSNVNIIDENNKRENIFAKRIYQKFEKYDNITIEKNKITIRDHFLNDD